MKKVFIVFLTVILICVLSVLPVSADSDAVLSVNTGDVKYNVGTARGLVSEICENPPFKAEGDYAVRVYGTSTADCLSDSSGLNYINLDVSNKVGAVKSYNKITVRFDFMLTEENTKIAFVGAQARTGLNTYLKFSAGEDVSINTWNRAAIVLGADGIDNTCRVYLNGKLYKSYNTAEGAYGFEKNGWIMCECAKGQEFGMYLDNVYISAGSTGYVTQGAPEIQSLSNGLCAEGDVVSVPYSTMVSQFKSYCVLNSVCTQAEVYDESGSLMGEDEVLYSDSVFVLSTDEGIQKFYKIKAMPSLLYEACGSQNVSFAPSGGMSLEKDIAGAPVKENGDTVYCVSGTADSDLTGDTHGKGYINLDMGKYVGDTTDYKNVKIEFNFLLCNEDTGLILRAAQYGTSGAQTMVKLVSGESVEAEKWQKAEIIVDTGENASSYIFYLNGVLHSSGELLSGASGFKFGFILPYAKEGAEFKMYADNIKIYGGNGNYQMAEPSYIESVSSPFALSASDMVLYIPQGENTAESILSAVSPEKSDDKVYAVNSSFEIQSGQSVAEDGCWVVVENASNTYAYYKINFKPDPLPVSLKIDESNVTGHIANTALGYAYEGGYWYSDSDGAAAIYGTNEWNPKFIEHVGHYDFKRIRIGGYSANYEMWKAELGDIDERIPTKAPAPEWYSGDGEEKFWRDGIEYIGLFERLILAESFEPDAKIVMCTNLWSAMPEDIDLSADITESVYPDKIISEDGTIDYNVLDRTAENITDLIRFCTLMPDSEKAVGTDGVNWAQKRVDLGHENPFNVDVWELGNEFFLRGISGETYAQMCNYVIPKIRGVFPDVKLSAHVSGNYSGWLEPVITALAESVNYVSVHSYYKYDKISLALKELEKTEAAIEASANPDLMILITEGGLSTFSDSYTGPSNQSAAMCTSFTDFMNRLSALKHVETFFYYGTPLQLSYNERTAERYGWKKSGSKTVLTEKTDSDGDLYAHLSGRQYRLDGIYQQIPLKSFMDEGYLSGDTLNCDISYDVMFESADGLAADENLEVKFEWCIGSQAQSVVHSKYFGAGEYTSGEWNHVEISGREVYIPKELLNAENACLKISLTGTAVPASKSYANMGIKNLCFKMSSSEQNLVCNKISTANTDNDSYRDTALAELMQYYLNHTDSDVVSCEIQSDSAANIVSAAALKTPSGLRLSLSNLSADTDCKINISSNNSYSLAEIFMISADGLYCERNAASNEINTLREKYSSSASTDSVILPKCSVMVLNFNDLSINDGLMFTDKISAEQGRITLSKAEPYGSGEIICAFYDDGLKLLETKFALTAEGAAAPEIVFESSLPYTSVRLFKWNAETLEPLGKSIEFKTE